MRAIEEPAPEATERIDAVMKTWQRQIGVDFEQQLRAHLGAKEQPPEAAVASQNGRNKRSRRNRKRRRK